MTHLDLTMGYFEVKNEEASRLKTEFVRVVKNSSLFEWLWLTQFHGTWRKSYDYLDIWV